MRKQFRADQIEGKPLGKNSPEPHRQSGYAAPRECCAASASARPAATAEAQAHWKL